MEFADTSSLRIIACYCSLVVPDVGDIKHNVCFDDSKENHVSKTELRDVAYESRIKFEENWIKASEHVKKYLRAEE